MRTLLTLAAAATLATATTYAEDSRAETAGGPNVTIGAGVLVKPEYSGADSYDTMAIPVLSLSKELTRGNTVYLRGLQAGLDHAIDDQLTVGAVANYRFKRDSSDSNRLRGMNDIDGAYEIGPKVRYQLSPQLGLEATALFDISGAYNGYTARAGADYSMPLSEVTMLTFAGGLNYGSKDFNNTYYGVTSAQAIAGRPAYNPGSGFTNVDASVGVRHSLTQHWSVQGNLGADYLMGDVSDSPLVDAELQPRLMLGVAYTF